MWRWLARGETTWASPATVGAARNVIASSIDLTFGAVALDALTRVDKVAARVRIPLGVPDPSGRSRRIAPSRVREGRLT
jgi:hypothetical protein